MRRGGETGVCRVQIQSDYPVQSPTETDEGVRGQFPPLKTQNLITDSTEAGLDAENRRHAGLLCGLIVQRV